MRDARGEPTGVLEGRGDGRDQRRSAGAHAGSELEEALRAAMKEAARSGVTSVQDLPGNPRDLDAWESLRSAGALTVRVDYRPSLVAWEKARDRRAAMKNDEWLRIGGVKGFADGSLGSGTALFFEPYADDPGNRGVFAADAIPLRKLEDRVVGADSAGLQVVLHAIGDRANAEMLDLFDRVASEERSSRPPVPHRARAAPASGGYSAFRGPRRHRLHAALPCRGRRPLGRKALGPGALPNGLCLSVAPRREGQGRIRIRLGCRAALAHFSELAAAVTRRTVDGKNPEGWFPGQRVTVGEAIRAYTAEAAWAAFEEGEKGTLTAGKLGDFVVLSGDPFGEPQAPLDALAVDATVTGGRIVHGG